MRRTSIYIASTFVLAFALSGCAAGLNAETRNITRVTDGNEITIDENGSEIRVVNLTLVDTGDGAAVIVTLVGEWSARPEGPNGRYGSCVGDATYNQRCRR